MPALSPTMDAGSIASWRVAEGDSFSAGDSIAEIQTDKATMEFEAQDNGVVAKILVQAGDGAEIKVGAPIMVTVEDEADVAAFKDFVPVAMEVNTSTSQQKETLVPPPASEETMIVREPTPAAAAAVSAAPPVDAAPKVQTVVVPQSPVLTAPSVAPSALTLGPSWGNLARVKSPLAKSLAVEQKKYIELYGSTGQLPL